jgi:hypothetical protein
VGGANRMLFSKGGRTFSNEKLASCAHRICSTVPVGYFLIGPCGGPFGRQVAVSGVILCLGSRMTPETAWKRESRHGLGIRMPLIPQRKDMVLMLHLLPSVVTLSSNVNHVFPN